MDIKLLCKDNMYELDTFICVICLGIFENAVSLQCVNDVHIFCEKCITKWLKKSNTCPICRCRNLQKNGLLVPITTIRNIIKKFKRYCENNQKGCEWIDLIEKYVDHKNICDFNIVNCNNKGCDYKIEKKNMKEHDEICKYKIILCDLCEIEIQREKLELHLSKNCPKVLIKCDICYKELIKEDMNHHLDNLCEKKLYNCDYNKFGCSYKYLLIDKIDHINTCIKEHMDLVLKVHNDISRELINLKKKK